MALVAAGRWPKEARPSGDGLSGVSVSDVGEDGPLDFASEARATQAPLAQFCTRTAVRSGMLAAQAMNSPAMLLPPRVAQTLRTSTRASGGVRALPMVDVDVRTERKGLAPSSMRERQFVWLRSKEGRAWLSSRQQDLRSVLEEEGGDER